MRKGRLPATVRISSKQSTRELKREPKTQEFKKEILNQGSQGREGRAGKGNEEA